MTISEQVTWKSLGDKIVAVKVDTGEYYTMNDVSSLIWKSIHEGKDAAEITAAICEEYEVDDAQAVGRDVEEQLKEWEAEKLIKY